MASDRSELQRVCITCGHVFVPDEALVCDACTMKARTRNVPPTQKALFEGSS
jgi:uncharacterized OB-fold protein